MYALAINNNNSKSYAQIKKALLKNTDETKGFNIYSSIVNQILEIVTENQRVTNDRNYQDVHLIETINQINFIVQARNVIVNILIWKTV